MVTLVGRLGDTYFQAVDLRLQSHRWMNDLPGRLAVEKVDLARLDALAAEHDLVLVASGRGPLAELFPRHLARSAYHRPQRKLAMVIVKGAEMAFADAVVRNFVDPRRNIRAFLEPPAARALLRDLTGGPWQTAFARGALRVAKGQLGRLAQRVRTGLDCT